MKEPKILEKFADEERVFTFDFSKQTDAVDIQTQTIIITPATTPPLTNGSPIGDSTAKTVKAEFQGGKAGTTYLVECRIGTSQGAFISMYGRLSIVDPSTWQ